MNFELTFQNLIIFAPLLLLELSLMAFCIVKIFKEGVANLNKWAWLAIVIVGNLFGSIIFLTLGRRRDRY